MHRVKFNIPEKIGTVTHLVVTKYPEIVDLLKRNNFVSCAQNLALPQKRSQNTESSKIVPKSNETEKVLSHPFSQLRKVLLSETENLKLRC